MKVMTRKELNQLKLDAYTNFIRMKYGQEALNRLNYAIKQEITESEMNIRSKDFDKKIDKIVLEEQN